MTEFSTSARELESADVDFSYDVDVPSIKNRAPFEYPQKAASEDALLGAYIARENPRLRDVEGIINEFRQQGASPTVEALRSGAARLYNQGVINKHLESVAQGTMSLEDAELSLSSLPAKTADDVSDLHQEMLTAVLMRQQANTAEGRIVAENKIAELVEKGYPVQAAIRDRIEWLKSKMSRDLFDVATGAAADLLPFATTIPFIQAVNQVFPENPLDIIELPRGELAVEVRKRMEALPDTQKLAVANQLMDALVDEQGILTGHDYQKVIQIEEALGEGILGEFGGLDRFVGNAISLMDSVALGWAGRNLFGFFRNSFTPGTPLSSLNIVDTEAAELLAAQGIRNDLSLVTGMTPAEILETAVVPKPFRGDTELLPPDIIKQLDQGDELSQDIIARTADNPLATTAKEKEQAVKELRKQMKQVGNAGLYSSNVSTRAIEGGVEYAAKYGVVNSRGKTVPFKTPREAVEHAAHTFPDAAEIRVFEKTPTGELKEISAGKTNFKRSRRVGEYVYEVKGTKSYANVLQSSNKIFFNDGDILASGPMRKYVLDPASRFSKWISGGFGQAGDYGRGINADLARIAKPFLKIPDVKKREVVKLLKEYQDNASNMTLTDIINSAGRDWDVVKGFMSYRQVMDTLWHLENRALRTDLLGQNAKHVVAGEFQGVGVKVSNLSAIEEAKHAADNVIEVYDPRKGQIVKMTPKGMQRLYETNHGSLYRVKEPIGDLARQTDLVIVRTAPEVRSLPAAVLNKIEGYIPRYYKNTYFLRVVKDGIRNGKASKNQTIIRAVGDKAEANKIKQQLVSEGKYSDEEIQIIHDRKMAANERATVAQQDNIALQRMFYHNRAEQQLIGIDGLAETSDPVEAMIKNMDATSRYTSHQELQQLMRQRWLNTFGTKMGLVDPKKGFPGTKEEIGATFTGAGKEKDMAIEMWEQIQRAESIMTREGELWRNFWVGMADGIVGDSAAGTIAGNIKSFLAKTPKFMADHSVNNVLRSVAFQHLIAANPFRQAYIQGQQWMYVAALAPEIAWKIPAQNKAIMVGLLEDAAPKVYGGMKNNAAKWLGMSTKEYEHFMKEFKATGLPDSVDAHDYVQNTLLEFSKNIQGGMLTRTGRKAMNIAKAPFNAAKKVGFNYGELSNLVNTFLIARHRYLARTGKKKLDTKTDFLETAADARNLALDMTHSGAFRYQDGALSALTQFLSIQHKAWLAMSPLKKVGNQAFTVQERRKLLAGQIILNGASGLGLYGMYQKGKAHLGITEEDLPEWADDYLVGGMYEGVINDLLAMGLDEGDPKLNISGSIAPGSGLNQKIGDVWASLFGQRNWVEAMAATNVINRYTDTAKTLLAVYDHPSLRTDDELLQAMSIFGSVTSGWNQMVRARAAARLGHHVSTSGSPNVQATFASMVAEGALGIQPHTTESYYNLNDEFGNQMINPRSSFDSDQETSIIAENLYKSLKRVVSLYQKEFDADLEGANVSELHKLHVQQMREAIQTRSSILGLYDPIERDAIYSKLSNLVAQDRTRGVESLIDMIVNKVYTGDLDVSKATYTINRLRGSGLYDPNTEQGRRIEFSVKRLLDSMNNREALSNRNLETIQELYNGTVGN